MIGKAQSTFWHRLHTVKQNQIIDLLEVAGDRWQRINEYSVVFELIRPLSEEQLFRLAQN
jgi:hypothetical protein